MTDKAEIFKHADKDGHFRRKESSFRYFISKEPSSKFPAEKNRYALYVNYGCPWAHRTIIVRGLKGMDDSIIQLIITGFELTSEGWLFTGEGGSMGQDPLYGFHSLKQLYLKADPDYEGRYTVPTLWDKKNETIVNNESSEIIRMLYSEFDDYLPEQFRETNRPGGGFLPIHLKPEIDAMNEWVYGTINNGVYQCGFATTQQAYENNLYPLFASLDRLEAHLAEPGHQPYLFGEHITEADIRLYTTLARFDVAYVNIFLCNLKMIRYDYPNLHTWLRTLYWDESERTNGGVFKKTTFFDVYKYGYLRAKGRIPGNDGQSFIVPKGPSPDIFPLDDEQKQSKNGTANGAEPHSALELPTERQKPQMVHGDENAKWESEIVKLPKDVPLTQP